MRINTAEELSAVEVGTTVLVGTNPWTKQSNGHWQYTNGATVEENAIRVHLPLETQEQTPFVRATMQAPEQRTEALVDNSSLSRVERRALNAESQRRSAEQGLEAYRQQVQDALHEYLENQGGLTGDEVEGIQVVLDDLGLERRRVTEDVAVTISVTGTFAEYMDRQMADVVGGDVEVDMERVNIEWSTSFHRNYEVEENSCACNEVDNDEVRELLDGAGISYDNFDFETECPNG